VETLHSDNLTYSIRVMMEPVITVLVPKYSHDQIRRKYGASSAIRSSFPLRDECRVIDLGNAIRTPSGICMTPAARPTTESR
jgi:hypothetical protein